MSLIERADWGRGLRAASPVCAKSTEYRGTEMATKLKAILVGLGVLALASCSGSDTTGSEPGRIGKLAQALTDTDGDGMDDDWELSYFGSLSATSGGDADSDGMTNGEEHLHGFVPNQNDAFEDVDGDRYPNVFELRRGSDPNSQASVPAPTYLVNGSGGGTHTTISAALNAANVANGAYQIIGIAPGVYAGPANLRNVVVPASKPKLLFIGIDGAAKTIIDGGGSNWGWIFQNSTVVSSLTFRNTLGALFVDPSASDVRFVDLVVRDNVTTPSEWASPGLQVHAAATGVKIHIAGSTFLNNTGAPAVKQINISAGSATLINTVVWGQGSGTMLDKSSGATLVTTNCLVKGQTLSGLGNLAGHLDPKLRSDGHIAWDSPLRSTGATVSQSRIDLDGDVRPSTNPDIGADQFTDSDNDDLADQWELQSAGNLATLTGRSQDSDSDGLSNEAEYGSATNPVVADTDGDGASDGDELLVHGSDPLSTDTDRDDMPDGWEITWGLSPVLADAFDDMDGDRYPNVFEYAYSANPTDRSSIPTSTYVVDAAGAGTHTTVSAALAATNVSNGPYQIIAIAPGVYAGAANLRNVVVPSSKPTLLFIGLEGAGKTIIEGSGTNWGWVFQNSTVVASLTFRNTLGALFIDSPTKEARFVDIIVRDNVTTPTEWSTPGLQVSPGATGVKVHVVGSVFLNNGGAPAVKQINIGAGTAVLSNTVVWSQSSGTMVAATGALTANNCVVKGQTLMGAGNLPGNLDPKLRSDGHLLWDSPLRAAGAAVAQSRIDVDGELRPTTAPDIGVDQFNDVDGDQLADQWEVQHAGNLTALTGRSQDADSDALSNEREYLSGANPVMPDTDSDGVSDGDEVIVHGSDPTRSDTDADDMPDGWEVAHGLSPVVVGTFDDNDGDRYPNVFEYAYSTDPSDRASVPTATYVVDSGGGGTHTTVSAALNTANPANGAYQIIGIAPGVYGGTANLRSVVVSPAKPKLLFIGLSGAANTIIDGGGANWGWIFQNSTVVASLTFRNTLGALFVDPPTPEVRFVDLIVRDNITTPSEWSTPGLQVSSSATGARVYVVGSTFLNNSGAPSVKQINISAGSATILNTVVWSQTSGTMLGKGPSATLTTNNCLVKGQTLNGSGNLAGNLDPKLRSDLRLRSDSPLRGAGGVVPQSRLDVDGELRPSSAPDIGVDQFVDSDADDLPDVWEFSMAGNTSSMVGDVDDDGDQLTNIGEYDHETNWSEADTDQDGLLDGVEVAIGTNPLLADAEDLNSDRNHDGLLDSIGAQLGYQPNQFDSDGDSISNADEALMCTNPLRADSDGDAVPDGMDSFPLDPLVSSIFSDPEDVTPPVITLATPWYAVAQ